MWACASVWPIKVSSLSPSNHQVSVCLLTCKYNGLIIESPSGVISPSPTHMVVSSKDVPQQWFLTRAWSHRPSFTLTCVIPQSPCKSTTPSSWSAPLGGPRVLLSAVDTWAHPSLQTQVEQDAPPNPRWPPPDPGGWGRCLLSLPLMVARGCPTDFCPQDDLFFPCRN